MEITVRKLDLLKELLLLQSAVERKATMPILAHILFDAQADGRVNFAASDMDLSLESGCAAKIKRSGGCAVPARKLLDYVRLLPDAEITIKLQENHWVQLRCGRANTRMVGMAKENFPSAAAFPAAVIRIPSEPLREAMAKTVFAISTEETRYTLNGALLVLKPPALTLVATDGHRLAHCAFENVALEGVSGETRALVPKKAMSALGELIEQAPEGAVIDFAQDETHLHFRVPAGESGSRVLTVRKLSGQFPNYEAVLPKQQQYSIPLNRDELAASIRRVAQFADERSHAIRLRLEKDKLVLASSSSDLGESDEELDAAFDGQPLVIGFNASYLEQFLDVVNTTEVLLELNDEQSAGQLRPRESEGQHYRYVVMPMRI